MSYALVFSAVGFVLLLLVGVLTLVSYVDRLYAEIGKFLGREFQDNIDSFEQKVEPKLRVGRQRADARNRQIFLELVDVTIPVDVDEIDDLVHTISP